ncbi:MAG: VanZ family protein [Eggerthellaceae bacterium]|nr:VanZ family protein [Eggerthellaceae bacterium]
MRNAKKAVRLLATILAAAFFFVAIAFTIGGPGYPSVYGLLGTRAARIFLESPLLYFGFIALLSIALSANVYQLLGKRFSVPYLKTEAALYVLLLGTLLMFKSRGIQGLNLNLLDVGTQLVEDPGIVALNVVLFIPFGVIVHRCIKPTWKAFSLALAIICVVETLQFLLHLGVADVVDVTLNMIGFSIGYLVLDIFRMRGWRAESDRKHLWIISPERNAAAEAALEEYEADHHRA